jgi:hypothetical protein
MSSHLASDLPAIVHERLLGDHLDGSGGTRGDADLATLAGMIVESGEMTRFHRNRGIGAKRPAN